MSAKVLFTLIGASSPGTQPLNTSLLSAVCKRAGHEVELFDTTFIDLGFQEGEINRKLQIQFFLVWQIQHCSQT